MINGAKNVYCRFSSRYTYSFKNSRNTDVREPPEKLSSWANFKIQDEKHYYRILKFSRDLYPLVTL